MEISQFERQNFGRSSRWVTILVTAVVGQKRAFC